jgi:hypothetical protein
LSIHRASLIASPAPKVPVPAIRKLSRVNVQGHQAQSPGRAMANKPQIRIHRPVKAKAPVAVQGRVSRRAIHNHGSSSSKPAILPALHPVKVNVRVKAQAKVKVKVKARANRLQIPIHRRLKAKPALAVRAAVVPALKDRPRVKTPRLSRTIPLRLLPEEAPEVAMQTGCGSWWNSLAKARGAAAMGDRSPEMIS